MERRYFFLLLILPVLLFSLSCSDDGSGDASSRNSTIWSGTLNGGPSSITFTGQVAYPESDGGAEIALTGSVAGVPAILNIDISGSADTDISEAAEDDTELPTADLSVANVDLNVDLYVDSLRYRGTQGTISLSTYDPAVGGTIQGSGDIGFVTMSGTGTATLTGSFIAVVVTPTPTEEE